MNSDNQLACFYLETHNEPNEARTTTEEQAMTTAQITTRQAEIIAAEAIEFMAKKAGVSSEVILQQMAEGNANVVRYFVDLLEIGGQKAAEINQAA